VRAAAKVRKQVDQLTVGDITAGQVRLFLQDLEQTRGCCVATRNQRLAVVHALARFIAERSPEHIEWCGTLGTIPFKRAMKREITYLEQSEMESLLAAPDRRTPQGQRDYALLLFLYNTGARADEAAQLAIGNVELAQTPMRNVSSVQIHGKGNRLRRCPLWPHTATTLTALLNDRAQHEYVFLNRLKSATTCSFSCVSQSSYKNEPLVIASLRPRQLEPVIGRFWRFQFRPKISPMTMRTVLATICRAAELLQLLR